MSTILKTEKISEQYYLGIIETGTLSHELKRSWESLQGKEDLYLKVTTMNDRFTKAIDNYDWAFRVMLGFTVINVPRTIGAYMGREPDYIKPIFNWENELV